MNIDQAATILEVSPNISKEELKIKFKKLVIKYHPDRNHSPNATEKFIEIKDAYETLFKHIETPIQQAVFNPGGFVSFYGGGYYGTNTSTTFTFTTFN